MLDKYLKNSIISFILITSTVLTPLAFIPQKANAQQGITGYISSSSAVISQLPLCQDKVSSALKNLFPSKSEMEFAIPDNFNNLMKSKESEQLSDSLAITNASNLDIYNSIPVVLPTDVTSDIKKTKENTTETKKAVDSINANDTCLKSIGRVVIKMLLQKITLSTVEWINSGYHGSPMFIQNPGDFFKDIAKNEILQFNLEISDPSLFPFGKTWMQNKVIAFNQKFTNNAQYSLNQLIKQTNPEFSAQSFNLDFNKGGWNAWNAMTQVPANNPLGFDLMASNELQQRLAGTNQSTAQNLRDNLQQASGYLGSERCVEPSNDITREEHNNALNKVIGARLCTRWEYVTPGQMVATAATSAIKYPENNLLKADDLNDAVAAILDAMLSEFSSDVMGRSGFAGLSNSIDFQQASEGDFIINNDSLEINTNFQDFPGYQVAGSSFLSQNPNFNIRKDLNQAVIDEQRIFLDKIIEQNTELKSTIDGKPYKIDSITGISNAYGLIPTIYQLDYCIPGPHPGYEIDSRNIFNATLGSVAPETAQSLEDRSVSDILAISSTVVGLGAAAAGAAIGATIGSGFPVVGTIIGAALGTIVGLVSGMLVNNKDELKVKTYYAMVITSFTGLIVEPRDKIKNYSKISILYNKQLVVQALNEVLERYFEIIRNTYKPEFMPSVTKEAEIKYEQQKGYIQMYKNNETKIIGMKSVILRLGEIKNNIEILNNKLSAGTINQAEYEEKLKPWISAFGRLSVDMVSGDDIAIVDNRIKQIVDEKDYIYNILLKGPTGCEKDIESNKGASGVSGWGDKGEALFRGVRQTKRMTYPAELLYDYNNYKSGDTLPDPYKSGAKNLMPLDDFVNIYGPGFLSWVWFNDRNTSCDIVTGWFGGCLKISDIIPVENQAKKGGNPVSYTQWDPKKNLNLAALKDKDPDNYKGIIDTYKKFGNRGIFESFIGIY